MEYLTLQIELLRDYLWSAPLSLLMVATGLWLTWCLKGLQFTLLPKAFSLVLRSRSDAENQGPGELTHFQALMTSLAAAIGTGNIAGVATALVSGGPGSLLWMCIIASIGMIIKFAESFLAHHYRQKNEKGESIGGPMYYLEKVSGATYLSFAFALFGTLATVGTGNMVQVHSVTDAALSFMGIPKLWSGILLSLLTAAVLFGGIRSIGRIAEVFVPVMGAAYLVGGCWVIYVHLDMLPTVLYQIVDAAFTLRSAAGGAAGFTLGQALQAGVSRGIFSNEAGLGTSSIAAATAKSNSSYDQALISMTGAFLSTFVVCMVTGIVICITQVQGEINPSSGLPLNGAPLAMAAFEKGFSGGAGFVSMSLIFFAYSTILGWAYYGEKCVEYLVGTKGVLPYRTLYVAIMVPAALMELHLVWAIADLANALMAIPNLIGLLLGTTYIANYIRQSES
ncbi:MAG: sodium:alanine symporter family protein [Zetaproteobacteria bacterium]|nr:sodium:alanine symporter family protein [Zetaproteobacteria bacterium]